MASIRLDQLTKTFGDTPAVEDLSLAVPEGELLVLLGPSGAGKSTTLRLIAGLATPTAGRIWLDDRDITSLPPYQRDLAMVFQDHTLYPHLTVRQNLEFGLRMRRTEAAVIAERVKQMAELLGLGDLLDRMPRQLSGGERQRVAIGRALVREPRAFLLDEPFAHLDAPLRLQLRTELRRLQLQLGTTMIHVTHDQEEALFLADHLAVMEHGKLRQVGKPLDVYERPANAFVAGFVGQPPMNLVQMPNNGLIGIRPQHVMLAAPGAGQLTGVLESLQPLGETWLAQVQVKGLDTWIRCLFLAKPGYDVGEPVSVHWNQDRLHRFDASTGERLPG